MEKTLQDYRERIRSGEINPLVRWDGTTTGLIFDPDDDKTPLSMMGFGCCRLDDGPHKIETGEREIALVPIDGAALEPTPSTSSTGGTVLPIRIFEAVGSSVTHSILASKSVTPFSRTREMTGPVQSE